MKLRNEFLFLLAISLVGLNLQAVPNGYELLYADEFEAPALNTKEWTYRTGERLGGQNEARSVRQTNGELVIDFFAEKNAAGKTNFFGGGVISKNIFGYGYYETKSKVYGGSPGLHSSFWTMGVSGDGIKTPIQNQIIEIDGYEVDSVNPTRIAGNIHYYVGKHLSVGERGNLKQDLPNISEAYVVTGFEWLPNSLRWYVNGVLFKEITGPLFYGPQNLWLTALATPEWVKIDPNQLPGVSSWQYVRYYGKNMEGVNRIANGDFEYNSAPGFEKNFIRDKAIPVAWIQKGDTNASGVATGNDAFSGFSFLRHSSSTAYEVTTYQRHDFLPNGMYHLSLVVRSTGSHSVIRISEIGASSKEVAIPKTSGKKWEKISLAGC
jgi:hypothetical protein